MFARVDESTDAPIAASIDNDRLATHERGNKVEIIRQLTFMSEVNPVLLEYMFHFELKYLFVCENSSVDSEQSLVRAFID